MTNSKVQVNDAKVEKLAAFIRGRTAVHEAGHAVIGVLLGIPLEYVTIVPRTAEESEAEGYWDYDEGTDGHACFDKDAYYAKGATRALMAADGVMISAGPLAQKLLFDDLVMATEARYTKEITTFLRGDRQMGAQDDYESADLAACALQKIGVPGEPSPVDMVERQRALNRFRRRARALVIKHERQIVAVAAHLVGQKDTMSGAEVTAIITANK